MPAERVKRWSEGKKEMEMEMEREDEAEEEKKEREEEDERVIRREKKTRGERGL